MPLCLVVGCSKITGRIKDKSTSFHQIPDPKKNRSLCASLLNNMGNAKWNILPTFRPGGA